VFYTFENQNLGGRGGRRGPDIWRVAYRPLLTSKPNVIWETGELVKMNILAVLIQRLGQVRGIINPAPEI
jgi:hypothetical protein